MQEKGLYIQMYSIHGLIRGQDLELGRDADTGGQTKYVVELGTALSRDPQVGRVELITRQIKDKNVSSDYSRQIEVINDKFKIIRIRCGGGKYIRKELLWPFLDEFIDRSINYIKSAGRLPDVFHSHYADAGYVCGELAGLFGIPSIHTGHSLGKVKLKKLLDDGMEMEDVEKRYKIEHRINIEQEVINNFDLIIASTKQEIPEQYGEYKNVNAEKFKVIPPGVNLEKFYAYNDAQQTNSENDMRKRGITDKLLRFFINVDKPLILTLCRPAKRKNISGLITAYGENIELQEKANLAIFAGIRQDIQTMEDNEREVLTEILLLMDKYNLYGKMAIPKSHDPDLEVPELYRITAKKRGVFANVALTEPFGLTLIEAAGTGLPVVATDDGGPRDIIANCKNGILVDIRDTKNIAQALNKILDNKKLWDEFSENGIKYVKRYYSWNAHVEKYLDEVLKLVKDNKEKQNNFIEAGKKLLDVSKLIVTDIDNTLVGDNESLSEFKDLIQSKRKKIGFAVATGRTIDSASNILKENNMPLPDVIISSVGSEIYYNHKGKLVYSKGWESHISHLWKRDKIVSLLKNFSFLKYQEDEAQRTFKISYLGEFDVDNLNRIKEELLKNKLKVIVIFSQTCLPPGGQAEREGKLLDILPYRASKGKAIRYLSFKWNIPIENILVAGDSGNDLEMFKSAMNGIVVANYSPDLEVLKNNKRVYFASKSYAGGILEGIRYFNFVNGKMEENYEQVY